MKIVSVVNYKGGVGKTTLTANIGAGLAADGKRVLLIDLDPQASLTFSFFTPVQWQEGLAAERTIKKWYDSPNRGRAVTNLSDLVVVPSRVNAALGKNANGCLDMIASHQDLVAVDTLLAGAIDSKTGQVPPSRFVQVYRRLAEGLGHENFRHYDYVLVDCPPNFQMMTKGAVAASGYLLIPSRADYLSINGINHLGNAVLEFIRDYNIHASRAGNRPAILPPPNEAVIFTMVQFNYGSPIEAQGLAISKVRALGVPTFNTLIRDRKAIYGVTPEFGIPAILHNHGKNEAAEEMKQFLAEFRSWTEKDSFVTSGELATLALEHVSKVLQKLTEKQLQDLAAGLAYFEFRSVESVVKSTPTRKVAPPPTFDVESVAAEIRALGTSNEVTEYLAKHKFRKDDLVSIARALGPTVSAKGTVPELKRNIAEGTTGFRERAAAVGGWGR